MSANVLALLGATITGLCLFWLALFDPKRIRVSRRRNIRSMSTGARRCYAMLAFSPGMLFAAFGFWVAFLIWLGFSCIAGWLLAMTFATIPSELTDD